MAHGEPDIAVFGQDEDLIMLVEVTGKDSTGIEWAVEVRDESLHDRRRVPEYFLVVALDAMYFWKDSRPLGSNPDKVLSTQLVLSTYLEWVKRDASKMRRDPLEFIVGIWLQDLTAGTIPPDASAAHLAEIGLPQALANGRIRFLAVA